MTPNKNTEQEGAESLPVSTSVPLPFDPVDLAQGVRVNQADFSRMCGVSRQTVSQWVKLGKIKAVYPDGSLDPFQAARDVIRNTDPARLRAKVFKVATEDAQALRARVSELERKLAAAYAYSNNLVQALRDTGVPPPDIEYMEWLAETGRRHTDTEEPEDDEIEALKLEGLRSEELPLFKQAAGPDEASEPSEEQTRGEQGEQGEQQPKP